MIKTDQTRVAELCRRYGIAWLLVFGSTAKGEQTAASDVDLLVEFYPARHLSLVERDALEDELPAGFGGRPIVLVNRKYLNRHIAPSTLAEADLQYAER